MPSIEKAVADGRLPAARWRGVCSWRGKNSDEMNKVIHRAVTRGFADHGWLKSWHTFSFADYFNPSRVHFGALRVLNDDTVAPGEGFDMHPHADMEIVTIPLEGALRHTDSMGNMQELRPGEIQVMSAGTGITHSEHNASRDEPAKFLQIWIMTGLPDCTPRYDRLELLRAKCNALRLIVAPEGCGSEHVGWIHQTAWCYTLELDAGRAAEFRLRVHGDGAYVFVLEGRADVAGEPLERRDGIGLWEVDEFLIKADTALSLLIIEVPME